MNLIEQLGGYERAKYFSENSAMVGSKREKLKLELLEYRRANNIFEEGDAVVIPSRGNGIFRVSRLLSRSEVKEMQHATDLEIKAGHRL